MLLSFLFPVFQVALFASAAIYLYSLSPLLALVVPLTFLPRIASHIVRGSRYYRLERKTVPMLREFQYLERCLMDREYFKETRILGAGFRLVQRHRSTASRFNAERWHEDLRIGGIDLGLSVLVSLGYAGSFVLAAFLLADGSIGVGGFAVVIYAVSRLMLMTRAVMDMFGQSYRASATASHLFEFLERDEGRPLDGRGRGKTLGTVTARKVSFTYPGTDTAAVDDVSVDLVPGSTVALVGANGAGKTTLAKLLLGLYVPSRGDVIRGTVNTRDATRSDIRERTSAVFQNFQRYQMTLRENVVLADVTCAEDEQAVIRALERGGVPAELWQGEEGLDLMRSREFGTRDLSLGQWQRVAIARGLFREHDVILLDEPTASIDPLEEQALYERFMEIATGRTAILVTHRLGSARLADRILVMQEGRIIEDGDHEDLLARRGLYHEMFSAQAAWYRRGPEPPVGHDPRWANILNLRASYYQETEEMVARLTKDLGVTRIAVLYQDDSFGRAGYRGVRLALDRRSMQPVSIGLYPRNTTAVKTALLDLQRGDPEAVIMIGAYQPVAALITWARHVGMAPTFLTVSFVGSNALAEELGSAGEGVYVTQVVPFPTDDSLPVVGAYLRALAAYDPDAVPASCPSRDIWRAAWPSPGSPAAANRWRGNASWGACAAAT